MQPQEPGDGGAMGGRVGRYEVLHELGRGGMGVVYEARDTELERLVALKALPADRADSPDRRKRFLHEARFASAINHPNIVAVYDIFTDEGTDWIVMELVEGRSLRELIPPEGLPVQEALRWAGEIADGLSAAHRAGIVHRDLKPGNVMIGRDGRARVLDFGLAKLQPLAEAVSGDPTASGPLTRAGTVLGTLEYMSPEQALARPVDGRADVFSLGVVLYQMLTGRSPFRRDSGASTVHAVAYEAEAPAESLRPETPEAVTGLTHRALEKDPARRFQTMAEMRAALSVAARAHPSGAPRRKSARWSRRTRRRQLALAAALGAAALAAALWTTWSGRGETIDAPDAATAGARPALPDTPFQLFRESQELLAHHWRAGYVDRAIDSSQRAVAADPDYAPAYAALAEGFLRRYESERDQLWLERAGTHARQALKLDPSLSSARLILGMVLRSSGDLDAAEQELREVVLRDPANARAYRGLADVESARGRKREAEALFREAVAREPEHPELHSALGTFLFGEGRYEEAAAAFRAATGAASDYVFGYRNAAAALHMLDRYDGAAEQLQRAIEIRPDAPSYSNLGTLYFFQGLYPQALEAYRKAIELGANDYLVWANLGDAYRLSPGHERDAERAYTRALQLLAQESGSSSEDPVVESRRALLLAKRGSGAAAAALAELWADRATDPSSLYRLGLAFELSGARERALATLSSALARGYSEAEIRRDPDLAALREDPGYHLMVVDASAAKGEGR